MKITLTLFLCFLLSVGAFARSIFTVDGNKVIIDIDGYNVKCEKMKVVIWSNNSVEIEAFNTNEVIESNSLIATGTPEEIKFDVNYSGNTVAISTKKILVNVEEDGSVRIFNREGYKMLIESNRSFDSTYVAGAYKINQQFFLGVHEHIFGFGHDAQNGRNSIRGSNFDLVQSKSSIASPLFFSEQGYAMIWDNYSKTNFKDLNSGLCLSSDVASSVRYFLIYGPEWDDIISEIRNISGKATLLPRASFGFNLNPLAYENEDELKRVIQKAQELSIPIESSLKIDDQLYKEELALTNDDPRYSNAVVPLKLSAKYVQLQNDNVDRRVVIPTHSGFVGMQKYGIYVMEGEVESSWNGLVNQVANGASVMQSVSPYWATTIGGSDENVDPELLARWYQFGAFNPIFEVSYNGRELWNAGSAGDPNFDAMLNAVKLRYKLLPYIYSTAFNTAVNNSCIMRSLLFDFRRTEKTHEIKDQFMFGPSIMVCPVTEQGATSRSIYLPPGNWYNFWKGTVQKGNTEISTKVGINDIPLFVKAGSIIPMTPTGVLSSDSIGEPIEIRIYPGADCTFNYFEDPNDGLGYRTEQFARIKFDYSNDKKTVEIAPAIGEYPGMPETRTFKIVLVDETNGIGISESENFIEVVYKWKKTKVKFE